MCLAAHDAELPGGPLKCQTFTVSPAEPGDFPLLVNHSLSRCQSVVPFGDKLQQRFVWVGELGCAFIH